MGWVSLTHIGFIGADFSHTWQTPVFFFPKEQLPQLEAEANAEVP